MRITLSGMIIFSIFGIFMLTTQGLGTSLNSTSEVNKIGTFEISDSSAKTLIGMNVGITDNISSITLTFKNPITENDTVIISLKDNHEFEIGSGFQIVNPSSTVVNITLSDSITSLERDMLSTASVTVT